MLTNRHILNIIDKAEDYKKKIQKTYDALKIVETSSEKYKEVLSTSLEALKEEYIEWLDSEITTQKELKNWINYSDEEDL